jgi:hypothetical protein
MAGISKEERELNRKINLISDWLKFSSGVRRSLLKDDDKWEFVGHLSVSEWQEYLEILDKKGTIAGKNLDGTPGWRAIDLSHF